MPTMQWVAPALLVLAMVAGCTPAPRETPDAVTVQPTPERPLPPAQQFPSCRQDSSLSEQEALSLLADIAVFAPKDGLTGDALAITQQWERLVATGWPIPTRRTEWATANWLGVEVSTPQTQVYQIRLRYGQPSLQRVWGFEAVCDHDRWRVRRSGANGQWERVPQRTPGPEGELTETLAVKLVDEARRGQGPELAMVATGTELERGRQEALRYAQGQTLKYMTPWPGVTERIHLAVESDSARLGRWLGKDGKETGESVRFEYVDGLWKVSNHTIQGKWVVLDKEWQGVPRGAVRSDLLLLGIGLGSTDADVRQALGDPDSERQEASGRVAEYKVRRAQVRFDTAGRVQEIRVRSGGSQSGILVGTPVEVVRMIHGPSSDLVYALPDGQSLSFQVADGVVTEVVIRRH